METVGILLRLRIWPCRHTVCLSAHFAGVLCETCRMGSGRQHVATEEVGAPMERGIPDRREAQMAATVAGVMIGPLPLAEDDALRASVDPTRNATVAVADELIRALAGVLDIREVFPQVSAIARHVLPHDRL